MPGSFLIMSARTQSVKGMNDLLPVKSPYWQFVEHTLREIAAAYGYGEIRTPILEKTALFVQSIGEQTDIVEKEMFAFEDTGGEHLCMRPECTASVVRAGVQHGLLHNTQARLWYMGPMFRRERPQKGRYRQFSQFGMEAFGWSGAEADVEVMLAGERIWRVLGVKDVALFLNSLGSDNCRQNYRKALLGYLKQNADVLDADSLRRLETNPLRVLDSKNADTQRILVNAPRINDYLAGNEKEHLSRICALLDDAGIHYEIDSTLVRGLDYYTSTVFEWKTAKLGAQNTVCAGGRYDKLVERQGGRATPACGFAMGMERLVELLQEEEKGLAVKKLDVWFISMDVSTNARALSLAELLRDEGVAVAMNHGVGKLKSQLKRADTKGARFVVLLGQAELERGVVQIIPLRGQCENQDIPFSGLADFIKNKI